MSTWQIVQVKVYLWPGNLLMYNMHDFMLHIQTREMQWAALATPSLQKNHKFSSFLLQSRGLLVSLLPRLQVTLQASYWQMRQETGLQPDLLMHAPQNIKANSYSKVHLAAMTVQHEQHVPVPTGETQGGKRGGMQAGRKSSWTCPLL